MDDSLSPEIKQIRKPDHPIHPLILNRWSPRAMSGEELSEAELYCLFEAARWAPSSYNNQPWRFLYAKRATRHWEPFFQLLGPFNKEWCAKAAVLGLILSRTTFEKNDKPCVTHALDTGAAWENMSLEAAHRGLAIHGMEGFDYKRARTDFKIPEIYSIEAMFAIGKRAPKSSLSEELQKREIPSQRNPVDHFAFEGSLRT